MDAVDEYETLRIKGKMAELVAKWKGKPEPPDKSGDWFRRNVDRVAYRRLKAKLDLATNGQQRLMNTEEQIAYARKIGLIN